MPVKISTRSPPVRSIARPSNTRGVAPNHPPRESDTSNRPQKEHNICIASCFVLIAFGICSFLSYYIPAYYTPAASSITQGMPLEPAHDEPQPSRQAVYRLVRRLMASDRYASHNSPSARPGPEMFEFLGMHPIAPECHPGSPAGSTGRAAHDLCREKILQVWLARMTDLGVSSTSVDPDRADDVGLAHAVADALLDGRTRVDYVDNVLPVLRPPRPSRFSFNAKAASSEQELNSVCPIAWMD
ncbi:hypothetical protein CCHR01_18159 [Colletotrichum chrysophilum]|uniref:Uncharacterized protein n=2 Tax=Colletotrichum chrysophilum TaxID=1836956 RepID=A0AAD9A279_9PEZI|nr:hypothetical protein CCHR01_18159 [Colletotrichum chrysophilum]